MKKSFLVGAVVLMAAITGLSAGCGGGLNREETNKRQLRVLPEDFRYETTKNAYNVEYDGISLYGEIYEPKADGKFPAVIFSHGYNGHYTDFPTECQLFSERGYVCYAFDFCGAQANGKSSGRSGADYSPLTMQEDLRAVIKNIENLPNVDETQIFLMGGSQGGFVTALTAAAEDLRERISAIALYFPAFNIPNDWSANYPTEESLPDEDAVIDFWGYEINGKYIRSVYKFDPYAVIGGYQKDVCIIWGDNDAIVKRQDIERAVEVYGERAELTEIKGAGHGFGGSALTTAREAVLAFFEARTYG